MSIALGMALAVLCTIAEEPTVRPYLQVRSDGSLTVMWATKTPAYGWVEYGPSDALGQTADLVIDGLRHANTTLHRVQLNDINDGDSLHYRAAWKPINSFTAYRVKFADPVYTPIHTAKTLPGPEEVVRAVFFNDIHSKHNTFNRLIKHLDNFAYDFSLFNGDCFMDPRNEAAFLRSLRVYNAGIHAAERPVIYHRGNHECRGAFARHIRKWIAPPGGRFYGAFTAGPVRFILLDAGEDKYDGHQDYSGLNNFERYRREQVDFLQKEVQSQAFKTASYRVLVHHIPLYDTSKAI